MVNTADVEKVQFLQKKLFFLAYIKKKQYLCTAK